MRRGKSQGDVKFSIVILNWNSGSYLKSCLDSIASQNLDIIELILVDNNSKKSNFAWVTNILENYMPRDLRRLVIPLDKNLGFTGGMNAGLAEARGDWLIVLNSDACLSRNFVSRLESWLNSHPSIDMVAVPVKKWLHNENLDHFTQELWSTGSCLNLRGSVAAWVAGIDDPENLLGCDGAIQIFSRRAYNILREGSELYAENYGSYGEDLDLYLRLRSSDLRIDYCSGLSAWHIGSASASTGSGMGFSKKSPMIKSAVIKNKWRNIYKIPFGKVRIILTFFGLLEDAVRARHITALGDYLFLHSEAAKVKKLKYKNFPLKWTILSRLPRRLVRRSTLAIEEGSPPYISCEE